MIPKIINYCWFGGNPLPETAEKCIKSWNKNFPDYEIKEWNESNFDLNCCDYIKEAYEAKKWAFVSDYARFWILYRYGGLYFDTDVEVIKPMDDLIGNGAFMGCEQTLDIVKKDSLSINPGLGLATMPGLGLYKEILEYYNGIHFTINANGIYDTVVEHISGIFKNHGFEGSGKIEEVEDILIYPPDYFCPMNYRTGKVNITENTYTIHWYSASWQSGYGRFKTKIQYLIGERATSWIIEMKEIFRK